MGTEDFSEPLLTSSPSYLQTGVPTNTSVEDSCVFDEEFKYLLLPISYGIVFVCGLVLNAVAIWMFTCKIRPWNPTTVYMFNLAVSDTLYVLSLPTLVYYYANRNNWPFGEALFKIVRFLFYANLYSSILFLTCISVHRYFGICHPIWSLKWVKVKYARITCMSVWVVVIACIIPNLFFVTTSSRGNDTLCHDTTKPEDFDEYVYYSSAVMTLLFGIPFLVIMVCYCLMAKQLCKPHVSSSHTTMSNTKKKSLKMVIIVLVVFAICFVPFHITRTLYYTYRLLDASCTELNIVNLAYKVTRPLASVNSCIDPILYFLAGDNYRGKLLRAITKSSPFKHPSSATLVSRSMENGLALVNNGDIMSSETSS